MARKIPLTKGLVAIVDDADFDLSRVKWHAVGARPYACRKVTISGKRVVQWMHRVIARAAPGQFVDHIDGNRLNNSRANLRLCTHAENMRNRSVAHSSKSGFKGVYFNKGCWCAELRIAGQVCRRWASSKEGAARAYDDMAREHHGEFARFNFPVSP